MPRSRATDVEGLVNVRDLGGLPLERGGATPPGVFLRSERPDRVPPAGWAVLADLGVRTVIDLRQDVERVDRPVRIPATFTMRHVDHDGLADHPGFWEPYWDTGLVGTPVYFLPHLAALPDRTVAVLHELAVAPAGGVLVHCAQGRDRTGLIAAVLLRIAGADDDAVTADYLATITNATALSIGQGRPDGEPAVAALLKERGTTSERAFRDFLADLDTDALLDRLPEDEARALRTWRGALG